MSTPADSNGAGMVHAPTRRTVSGRAGTCLYAAATTTAQHCHFQSRRPGMGATTLMLTSGQYALCEMMYLPARRGAATVDGDDAGVEVLKTLAEDFWGEEEARRMVLEGSGRLMFRVAVGMKVLVCGNGATGGAFWGGIGEVDVEGSRFMLMGTKDFWAGLDDFDTIAAVKEMLKSSKSLSQIVEMLVGRASKPGRREKGKDGRIVGASMVGFAGLGDADVKGWCARMARELRKEDKDWERQQEPYDSPRVVMVGLFPPEIWQMIADMLYESGNSKELWRLALANKTFLAAGWSWRRLHLTSDAPFVAHWTRDVIRKMGETERAISSRFGLVEQLRIGRMRQQKNVGRTAWEDLTKDGRHDHLLERDVIRSVVARMVNLKKLESADCAGAMVLFLDFGICQTYAQIKSLSLQGGGDVLRQVPSTIWRSFRKLKVLKLRGTELVGSHLRVMAETMKGLEELELPDRKEETDEWRFPEWLAVGLFDTLLDNNKTTLRKLRIDLRMFPDHSAGYPPWQTLCQCQQLEDLWVESADLDMENQAPLSITPAFHLKKFSAVRCTTAMRGYFAAILHQSTDLQELMLYATELDRTYCRALASVPLQSLVLVNVKSELDLFTFKLLLRRELKHVRLEGEFPAGYLHALSECTNLEDLSISEGKNTKPSALVDLNVGAWKDIAMYCQHLLHLRIYRPNCDKQLQVIASQFCDVVGMKISTKPWGRLLVGDQKEHMKAIRHELQWYSGTIVVGGGDASTDVEMTIHILQASGLSSLVGNSTDSSMKITAVMRLRDGNGVLGVRATQAFKNFSWSLRDDGKPAGKRGVFWLAVGGGKGI
ncbi:hypothetical protein HDV00_006306 [Rhizophlyctis rosea]|nr:hypothetical protein HDV00_006306 [Rhizophlyctis rosea]